MIKLNDEWLHSVGLGELPAADKNQMLSHAYETLEMRVGMHLATHMSTEQLNEFEVLIQAGDEAGALAWLETNFPDYREVVRQQLDVLEAEIIAVADRILASASDAAPR